MRITVFTPTYNRARTLNRVFESLQSQTFRDFEWLIVDDGSTDDTAELVTQWQEDGAVDFPIRYLWQENAHKKVAHNRAVLEARGELFLVLDSDDWCVPVTLERFWHYWTSISEEQRDQFVGVWSLCMDESGAVVGNPFPATDYIDSNLLEIKYRYRVFGEKWGIMRTDILRQFPFREDIPGLVPEGTVWDAIAKHYKTRFINQALRIYCQDVPGLIARKNEVVDAAPNAPGGLYQKKFTLENNIEYVRFSPKDFLMEAARLTRFWLHTPEELRRRIGFWPNSALGRLIVIFGSPLGVVMWLMDRRRQKKRAAI